MRQTTQYTCGPAAILTILNALKPLPSGRDYCSLSEIEVSDQTNTKPVFGTENDELVKYLINNEVTKNRVLSHGESTYHNGLAIANIRNWRSGIGHFVVLLGLSESNKDEVHIYDPLDGQIHLKRFDDFEWKNANGDLSNWSINFTTSEDELASIIDHIKLIDKKMVHIIKGDTDLFDELYDTVTFLQDLYLKKQDLVNLITDKDINIYKNDLFLGGIKVNAGDTVWVKVDPKQSESYFLTLRLLVPFESKGVKFVNPPSLILSYDDKTIPLIAGSYSSQVYINTVDRVEQSLYGIGEENLVVKRLNGFGGRDVAFSKSVAEDVSKLMKEELPYIIEKSIAKEGLNTDTRIFWYKGKYVGAINKYANGNNLCNMTQGGEITLGDIDEIIANREIENKLKIISHFLTTKGFVIAGVDVLKGELITEVNVSNPSIFKNYIQMSGHNFLLD